MNLQCFIEALITTNLTSLDFITEQKHMKKLWQKKVNHIMVKMDSQKCMIQKLLKMLSFIIFLITKKKAASFKETFLYFPIEAESNLLFSAVIYGIYYLQKSKKPTDFLSAIEKIGQDKILKLEQKKKSC